VSFRVTSDSSTGAVVASLPAVPIVGAKLVCDAVVYDQQHFLDLFDRLFPFDYLAPMKLNPNSGYELLQAFAAVGARLSEAIAHLECGALIIYASGGEYAVVPVILPDRLPLLRPSP